MNVQCIDYRKKQPLLSVTHTQSSVRICQLGVAVPPVWSQTWRFCLGSFNPPPFWIRIAHTTPALNWNYAAGPAAKTEG